MPQRQTERELLEERARIDKAMAQLESAKQKARQQRAEYGKYLEWKVKMQRKERKQRAEEEKQMRERIDEKLRSILKEHREQKHRDRSQWKEHLTSPVRKRSPLRIADASEKEDAYLRSIEMEQIRRRNEIDATRDSLRHVIRAPKSAPAATKERANRGKRPLPLDGDSSLRTPKPPDSRMEAQKSVPRNGVTAVPQNELAPATAAVVAGVKAAAQSSHLQGEKVAEVDLIITPQTEKLIEQSHETGQFDMDTISGMTVLPDLPSVTKSQLTEAEEKELHKTTKARGSIAKRRSLVENMYATASKARLYATSRMLADPPADYLIGGDVMRYIPADLLDRDNDKNFGVEEEKGASSGPSFFVTQVEEQQPSRVVVKASSDQDTSIRDVTSITSASTMPRKQLQWKQFNENQWMGLPEKAPVRVVEERIVDEEKATLEWYKTYHEKYTRVRNRTQPTDRKYEWQRQDKHVLPKKNTAKFDEQ